MGIIRPFNIYNLNTNIPYGLSIDIDKMTVKVKNFVTNFYLVLIQHSH